MTKIMRTQVKMGVMRMKLIMKMKKKADDDLLNIEIQQTAKELATDWQTGDWVAVVYNCDWYPGIIQDIRFEISSSVNLELCNTGIYRPYFRSNDESKYVTMPHMYSMKKSCHRN